MARLLFRLTNVPDDEAMEVRQLLDENGIHFYETDAGRWKVGVDAIWLPDDTQYVQAKALLENYQQERTKSQQQVYAELEASGEAPTFVKKIAAHPIRFLAQVIAVVSADLLRQKNDFQRYFSSKDSVLTGLLSRARLRSTHARTQTCRP